uniref:7TM_GPCR_Srx domain-containing protein n=1 Tax=Panagrellus redivivus TaxID=6233 RepID=A0A7E4VAR8_PANRE
MEHSDLFYNLILCSTGTLSLICYIVGSYWYKKVWQKSVRVTVGNRTFGGIVGFFYLCMPISSILTSVYSMFFDSFDSKTSYYTRTSMAFATQIIDQSTIIISFDIAVATLRRTQKPLLQTKLHGFVVAFVCVAMSAFCYNVTHIIMTVIFIWSSVKRSRQRGSRIFTTVTGRVMHPRQTLDEHFQQLHFQWK